MNSKQKVGYTFLGAAIMLIGMGGGFILSPPLTAQRGEVFDKIQCSKLEVVDKSGKVVARLGTGEGGQGLSVFDKAGDPALKLGIEGDERGLVVFDKAEIPAFHLIAFDEQNEIVVFGKAGKEAIVLLAPEENEIAIRIENRAGKVRWRAP